MPHTPHDGRMGDPKLEAYTVMARRRGLIICHAVIQVAMSMLGVCGRENPRSSNNSKQSS